jgi:hypothetical protein
MYGKSTSDSVEFEDDFDESPHRDIHFTSFHTMALMCHFLAGGLIYLVLSQASNMLYSLVHTLFINASQ